ncbi:sulfotransferase [Waterburya agarophytonicola K14]|uniref:Sulfotransferase n=1 Tax=Waterburya agarophytonicola KI4 TaxID=2874699 RepID=A0A964FI28_9CYAN|nr:sulfotransferase [Waterburya agarophytonicola]MCC0179591.1 sulfotransferase [Waterburya agarophytonicola KI4]
MLKPNFLIIGAAKSGTTSLAHYLGQHEDIFMSSIKETRFFALEGKSKEFQGPKDCITYAESINDWDSYLKLFANSGKFIARGEASPIYLCHPDAPSKIKHYLDSIPMIIILRNPIERAFSSYLHLRRDNRETYNGFRQALNAENERIDRNYSYIWRYTELGFYAKQLKRYFDYFPRHCFKIFLYEDFQSYPQKVIASCCDFIGVESVFKPQQKEKLNISYIPRSRYLQKLANRSNFVGKIGSKLIPHRIKQKIKAINQHKPTIDLESKAYLQEIFKKDILDLQNMLNRDLSHWLE